MLSASLNKTCVLERDGHLCVNWPCVLFVLAEQRKRNVLDGQAPCCPVCGLTLRSGEIEVHLNLELEKLEKLSKLVHLLIYCQFSINLEKLSMLVHILIYCQFIN